MRPGSSGMDLAAHIENSVQIEPYAAVMVPARIAVSIPKILKYN